jgi:regulator of RNase E activity RraA
MKLSAEQLQALRLLDGCTMANAIEAFHERLRNEGFANGSLRCLFPEMEPLVGYAATVKIRGSAPPTASSLYPDRMDLWDYILSLPSPRVVVVQDAATRIGLGSLVGAVHMNIFRTLGCLGAVTNGSVRDLPAARSLGFQLFTGSVAVSHAYVHIIEFGTPVEIAGLKIKSGDLLHGDQHGIQTVPFEIAGQVPAVAARIREKEQAIISLCHSSEFSLEKLRATIESQSN